MNKKFSEQQKELRNQEKEKSKIEREKRKVEREYKRKLLDIEEVFEDKQEELREAFIAERDTLLEESEKKFDESEAELENEMKSAEQEAEEQYQGLISKLDESPVVVEEPIEETTEASEPVAEGIQHLEPNFEAGKTFICMQTPAHNEHRKWMRENGGGDMPDIKEGEIELHIYTEDEQNTYGPTSGGEQICQGDDFHAATSGFRKYITQSTVLSNGLLITDCIIRAIDSNGFLSQFPELNIVELNTKYPGSE